MNIYDLILNNMSENKAINYFRPKSISAYIDANKTELYANYERKKKIYTYDEINNLLGKDQYTSKMFLNTYISELKNIKQIPNLKRMHLATHEMPCEVINNNPQITDLQLKSHLSLTSNDFMILSKNFPNIIYLSICLPLHADIILFNNVTNYVFFINKEVNNRKEIDIVEKIINSKSNIIDIWFNIDVEFVDLYDLLYIYDKYVYYINRYNHIKFHIQVNQYFFPSKNLKYQYLHNYIVDKNINYINSITYFLEFADSCEPKTIMIVNMPVLDNIYIIQAYVKYLYISDCPNLKYVYINIYSNTIYNLDIILSDLTNLQGVYINICKPTNKRCKIKYTGNTPKCEVIYIC